MKLYVISADIYEESYGSQISIFGVFDEVHLDNAVKELENKYGYYFNVNEINLNESSETYLGGYFE